jgi:hypothetical protein
MDEHEAKTILPSINPAFAIHIMRYAPAPGHTAETPSPGKCPRHINLKLANGFEVY